jgi:N-acetylglutamate synthase-like GNAT family acetyltransferase
VHAPEIRPARPADRAEVLALLESQKGLEIAFEPEEFMVATEGGQVVACGRLRTHADGSLELASVATHPGHRGRGVASALVQALLRDVQQDVYALALAPGFFARHRFAPTPPQRLPSPIAAKASGLCSSQDFVCMARPARGP